MAFGTDPPDFAAAAGDDVFWCEGAVFGWVPLFGEGWQLGGEIVVAALHGSVGADGAACAVDAGFYLCAPLVTMCAAPPDDAMAAGEHVARCEVAVFLCVPFLGEEWIFCGEIVFSGDGEASAAIGAACAAAGAGVHGGLPVVAVCAGPPDFFLAAVADGLRCEGKIFFAVPLAEKISAVVALAKASQGFSHGLPPPFYVEPLRNQYSAAISEDSRADFRQKLLAGTKFFARDCLRAHNYIKNAPALYGEQAQRS